MLGAGTLSVLVYVGGTSLGVGYYLKNHGELLRDYYVNGSIVDVFGNVSLPELWPAAKEVLNNEAAIFLALNWFFSVCTAAGLVTTVLYLGRLSQRESSRMAERLVKYIVQKFVFVGALSIGSDPAEVMLWLVWFYMVGFWRVFAGAAKDRMEALAVAPRAHPQLHVRAVMLLLLIMAQDAVSMYTLFACTWRGFLPMSKMLLCVFDTSIILLESVKGILVYATHVLDRRMLHPFARNTAPEEVGGGGNSIWESWEGKGSFLYHLELFVDTVVHVLTLVHYLHIWLMHGLKLKLVDVILCLDVRAVVMSLQRRLKAYASYRAATHCLQHAFPDAHVQQLGEGNGTGVGAARGRVMSHDCSICMETMTVAKQLPCGHCFHLSCLRAWLQQSGSDNFSCPLCRQPLLEQERRPRGQQDELRNLELLRQPGLIGSLRRARQRIRMWILALAVGVVAAAMQSSEVVVHRGRGLPRRGATGRRSSRQQLARRSSMRRRQFRVLQEFHAPGEEMVAESDDPPSGALLAELHLGIGHESNQDFWEEHAQDDDEEQVDRDGGREAGEAGSAGRDANSGLPGPSTAAARPVDAVETWLGGTAVGMARSIHSSFGVGGVGYGAVAGHEPEGEEEVISTRQMRGGAGAGEGRSRRAVERRAAATAGGAGVGAEHEGTLGRGAGSGAAGELPRACMTLRSRRLGNAGCARDPDRPGPSALHVDARAGGSDIVPLVRGSPAHSELEHGDGGPLSEVSGDEEQHVPPPSSRRRTRAHRS